MNKHLLAVAFLVLGLAVLAPSVQAQTSLNLNTKVPFDFTVGNRVLPAGDYEVCGDAVPGAIVIRSADWRISHGVIAIPMQAPRQPEVGKLVFTCYGGRCFLSQLWSPRTDIGREFLKSKLERELARNKAGENVLVAATPR